MYSKSKYSYASFCISHLISNSASCRLPRQLIYLGYENTTNLSNMKLYTAILLKQRNNFRHAIFLIEREINIYIYQLKLFYYCVVVFDLLENEIASYPATNQPECS